MNEEKNPRFEQEYLIMDLGRQHVGHARAQHVIETSRGKCPLNSSSPAVYHFESIKKYKKKRMKERRKKKPGVLCRIAISARPLTAISPFH